MPFRFYVKSILEFLCRSSKTAVFCNFSGPEFGINQPTKSARIQRNQCVKMADFALLGSLKLIWRKICVTQKSLNLHIMWKFFREINSIFFFQLFWDYLMLPMKWYMELVTDDPAFPRYIIFTTNTRFGQWIPQNPFWALDSTQCGNFIIFLSLRFCVKSKLANLQTCSG